MSKSSPQVPATPSPTATANAQTASNLTTSAAQAAENNVNQVTPYGSNTFDVTGSYTNPATGQSVPTYTENTQLSPLLSQILGQEQGIATNVLGTVANQIPNLNVGGINESVLPSIPSPSAPSGTAVTPQTVSPLAPVAPSTNFGTPQSVDVQNMGNEATNAAYNEAASFLNPQFAQQQQNLQDQLAQQGISVGSQAYNNAETQFANSQNQAYNAAANNAILQGANIGNEQSQLGINQNANLYNEALAGQNSIFNQNLQSNENTFGQNLAAAGQNYGQNLQSEQNAFNQALAGNQNVFNQAVTGQQQGLAEQQTAENQPVNLLTQLLGGVPSLQTQNSVTPATTSVNPTDVIGAQALSTNAAEQNYQAQLAQQDAMFGGLASLGGSGLMALALSDGALKWL